MAICPFAIQTMRWDATWPMAYTSGPWRALLHTTEGTGVPTYADDRGRKGAKAPHFTLLPDITQQQDVVYQHFDTNRPSRALANTTAPGETNREQVVQIELVGTCGWVYTIAPNSKAVFWPDAPEWALAGLRRLMRWIEQTHGIPSASTPRRWTAWNARPDKMTPAEWDGFRGWCGHSHVPENDHTDPGALPIGRLLAGPETAGEGGLTMAQIDDILTRLDNLATLVRTGYAPADAARWPWPYSIASATLNATQGIPAAVIAGSAQAIADAIPDELAREVVDALASRLTPEPSAQAQ